MLAQKHADSMNPETSAEPVGGGGGPSELTVAGPSEGGPSGAAGPVSPGGCVNGEGSKEFLSTGRTGRRNAMPDILGEHMETNTAGLPEQFEGLTTSGPDGAGPSGQSSPAGCSHGPGEPSTSQQQHAG